MKLFKSRKALSPVVASIILIAVTVAVSIAVAAWMGALTIGFMGSGERLKVGTPYGWTSTSVKVLVTNEGGSPVKITGARVQGYGVDTIATVKYGNNTSGPVYVQPKATEEVLITLNSGNFESGYEYTIILVTGNNNEFRTSGTKP
ncbi:MAG: archaellin/type IV pilin N-terminal domain-containing protein [Candidatus Bathyarchaeia archaeon]